MNEIKVNKPLNIFLKLGKKYMIQFESGNWYKGKLFITLPPGDDDYSVGFKTPFGDYYLTEEEVKTRLKEIEPINEIKRLQQLAGINEIKISNPIISKEDIIELYNKIDNYLDTIWEFDDFGEDQNPIAIDLDKKLNNIIKTIGPSYLPSTKIESIIPSDPMKKLIFYQKLKELDSKIDYNYTI